MYEDQNVDHVLLWHEKISVKNADDLASAFIKCINLAASTDKVLWVNNCAGQNKNWACYTALVWYVNQN